MFTGGIEREQESARVYLSGRVYNSNKLRGNETLVAKVNLHIILQEILVRKGNIHYCGKAEEGGTTSSKHLVSAYTKCTYH